MFHDPLPCLTDGATTQELFHTRFDRSPFAFEHLLHRSEYFRFDTLLALADRVSSKPNRWYVEAGDTRPQNGWNPRPTGRTLRESLEGIAENNSFVMLKRVHEEPEYGEILRALTGEVSELSGIDMSSRYRDALMTVIITSPGRVTPYHIDGEMNLLMQMQGSKSVYIFDGNDREILPTEELEGFWCGDIKAPLYKERLQSRAWRFELVPGAGVANPVTFPHWVQNGSEVSISLSTNFKRVVDNSADAYRVNRQLRRLGLHPSEPGKAALVDHAKGTMYRGARWMKKSLAHLHAGNKGMAL